MLNKTLVAATLLTGFAASSAFASSLSDSFHSRTSTTPGATIEHMGTRHVIGPSFRWENDVNMSRNLFHIEAPSWSAGCGGIDFFAGSFSIITKDELVQMGRGIMQGAPGYFFNLAIDSICPGCAANMKDLANRLNSYNQFGQQACEQAWSQFHNITSMDERTEGIRKWANTHNPLTKMGTGLIPDYGTFMSSSKTRAPEAGETAPGILTAELAEGFDINLTHAIMRSLGGHETTYPLNDQFNNFTLAEIAMSIFGTRISFTPDVVAGQEPKAVEKRDVNPELDFRGIALGEPDTTIALWRCNTTEDRCLSPFLVSVSGFTGIVPLFERDLVDILQRINRREALLPEQLDFVRTFPLAYGMLSSDEMINIAPTYVRYLGLSMARQRIRYFFNQFYFLYQEARLASINDAKIHAIRDDFDRLVRESKQDLELIDAELKGLQAKEFEGGQMTMQMAQLLRSLM